MARTHERINWSLLLGHSEVHPNCVAKSRPSRPGEFHPEPLTDPCLTVSSHTARATQ
jgi:hypothetical protein